MDFDPRWADSIANIESGGQRDPYNTITPSPGGRRALGKYQVMAENVPEWTQAALGQSMTPEQFLANPDAQETVFKHRFGGYVDKYGTPQDAASAWFTGRPINASSAGAHDALGTSGASYVQKFNAGLDGPTAIQNAMHSQGGKSMPTAYADDGEGALSTQSTVGPGVLAAGTRPDKQDRSGLLGGMGYGGVSLHNRILGAAAALGSIYNPQGAAVLNAQVKQTTPTDQFTTTVTKDGSLIRLNTKTGEVTKLSGNYGNDSATEAYNTARAKANSDLYDKIDEDAGNSQTALNDIGVAKQALGPTGGVYQGSGGEKVADIKKFASSLGIPVEGVANADLANAAANRIALQAGTKMKGSFSDKDVVFLKSQNFNLNNKQEANAKILENLEKAHNRVLQVQQMRDQYAKSHGGKLDDNFRSYMTQWSNANPLFADQYGQSAAQATAAPASNALPQGVHSINVISP